MRCKACNKIITWLGHREVRYHFFEDTPLDLEGEPTEEDMCYRCKQELRFELNIAQRYDENFEMLYISEDSDLEDYVYDDASQFDSIFERLYNGELSL